MSRWQDLIADDGFRVSTYRADPAGAPRGGIVVVQEIFGVNSHIRNVCDGFAEEGYVAMAPALFDRVERGVELGYEGQDMTRARELKGLSETQSALRDVAAAMDALQDAGRVGVVGFCWGGFVTWMAAAKIEGIACAVSYYGGGMLEALGEKPKCPVMAHFGRQDTHIPVEGVQQLQAAHPETKVFLYDAGHGFNCDQRGSFNQAASRLAHQRTADFLHQHVG